MLADASPPSLATQNSSPKSGKLSGLSMGSEAQAQYLKAKNVIEHRCYLKYSPSNYVYTYIKIYVDMA